MTMRAYLLFPVLFAFLACDDASISTNNTNNVNNVNNVNNLNNLNNVNNLNNIPGCESDLDCANTHYCDSCASASCEGCTDCIPGCVPHGCPTEAEPACNAMRPECGESGVAVVTGLCWECVDLLTCVPWRDNSCDDGTEAECDMAEPQCEEGEILAIQDNCYRCVNPATCLPWGMAGCYKDVECASDEFCDPWGTSACPICAQAVPACSPNPCDTGVQLACYAIRPDCGPGNAAVVAADGCWQCQELGTCAVVTEDEHCNDGTELTCLTFDEIVCAEHELKAIQAGCAVCVDPTTCNPWGANECTGDFGCGIFERCERCASSSCPDCDDCVSACVPHGCPSEMEPACNGIRPDCGTDAVAVSMDGCWICVAPGSCEPTN